MLQHIAFHQFVIDWFIEVRPLRGKTLLEKSLIKMVSKRVQNPSGIVQSFAKLCLIPPTFFEVFPGGQR